MQKEKRNTSQKRGLRGENRRGKPHRKNSEGKLGKTSKDLLVFGERGGGDLRRKKIALRGVVHHAGREIVKGARKRGSQKIPRGLKRVPWPRGGEVAVDEKKGFPKVDKGQGGGRKVGEKNKSLGCGG